MEQKKKLSYCALSKFLKHKIYEHQLLFYATNLLPNHYTAAYTWNTHDYLPQ